MALFKYRLPNGTFEAVPELEGKQGKPGKGARALPSGGVITWWEYDEILDDYVDTGIVVSGSVANEVVIFPDHEGALTNIQSGSKLSEYLSVIKAWFASLKALAFKDKVNWNTDVDNKPSIPSNTSDITNDSGYITNAVNNLVNYYLKTETYTRAEIQALINAIRSMSIQSVTSLPTEGVSNVIYLVPKTGAGNDVKDEYIWIGSWEKIGSTDIDLSGYYTSVQVDALLEDAMTNKADKAIEKTSTLVIANWVDDTANSGYFKYTISDEQILATSIVVHVPASMDDKCAGEEAGLDEYAEATEGTLVIYSASLPAEDINIKYIIQS